MRSTFASLFPLLVYHADARSCTQGGCYGRQDSDDHLQDLLPKFFFHG